MIGGGYGIHHTTESATENEKNFLRLFVTEAAANDMMKPTPSQRVFEVQVSDSRNPPFLCRAADGVGWEWGLFDARGGKLPLVQGDLFFGSPSLHIAMQWVAWEDFEEPPSGAIVDNDEDTNYGRRVVLQGLVGSKHLNGLIGRCGPWLPSYGRYHVALEKGDRSISIKATNLRYAPKRDEKVFGKLVSSNSAPHIPIMGVSYNKARHLTADQYNGPLSASGMSLLNYVASKNRGYITLIIEPIEQDRNNHSMSPETVQHMEFYERFVEAQKEIDTVRVRDWTKVLVQKRDMSKWSEWLKLVVELDAVRPPIRRELYVSPHVSMAVRTTRVNTETLRFHDSLVALTMLTFV